MSADVPETIASDERIVRLRDWLAVSVTAEERAQAESLQRARDLMSLYEDRQDEWVAWMDEHYPVRKSFGRPGDPRSFNRFAGFLVKSGLVDMASRRAYHLRDADDVVRTYLNRVQISQWNAATRPGGTPTYPRANETRTAPSESPLTGERASPLQTKPPPG